MCSIRYCLYVKQFNKQTGQRGEDIAAQYLESKGYYVVERNFTSNFGEVDIIALHQNSLIFVEVKYRSSLQFGEPYEAVNPHKLHKLRQMVDYYYLIKKPNYSPKIEIISIARIGGEINIKHIHTIIF